MRAKKGGATKDSVPVANGRIANGEKHGLQYNLDPKEFGPLEHPTDLYVQRHEPWKEIPLEVEDLPGYFTFITTYIAYLMLMIVGHVRDFFARWFLYGDNPDLKASNGYGPLLSDFDSFYTRRLKQRLTDCFNRPCTGVPGRFISVLDRTSSDFYYTFEYPGTTKDCLNLSSYNYLGFAQSVGQCTDAAEVAIKNNGLTGGATRTGGGTLDMHLETEQVVADFVGKEAAAMYSMGYATNAYVFASLLDKQCLVISDELNHASIRSGIRLSKAVIKVFSHNDMAALEQLLREQISQGQPRTHRPWKKILVVVEGLYSMEGTMCNLPKLVELKQKYKYTLFVDEAHSIGAMGPNGRGVCDYFSIEPSNVDILMGTFTKSFGATGGYIAADKVVIDSLKVSNMGNFYSEPIAPPVLAQIQSSLKTITGEVRPGEGKERLQRLAFNSRYLRLGLHRLGFTLAGVDDSPIIPLMLYQPTKMPALSRLLLEQKIAVVVVGYPATPVVSSRARLCVSAALTRSDLDRLLRALDVAGNTLRLKTSQKRDKNGNLYRWDIDKVIPSLPEDVHKDFSTFE